MGIVKKTLEALSFKVLTHFEGLKGHIQSLLGYWAML